MWNSLVPGLLLTAVVFSTSDVLPIVESEQKSLLDEHGQIDNTFSYKDIGDLHNTIQTVPAATMRHWQLKELGAYDTNQNQAKGKLPDGFREIYYDDEGFRTKQWHSYLRRLDRLHDYLYYYRHDKSIDSNPSKFQNTVNLNYISREFASNTFDKLRPLNLQGSRMIAKTDETLLNREDLLEPDEDENDDNKGDEEAINHAVNPFVKLNRRSPSFNTDLEVTPAVAGATKKVSKRIFSLWSRLQDLSHKGHELPHRRHMAFYALPHNARTLTAETRAQLRPPGSPLRVFFRLMVTVLWNFVKQSKPL